eukprot:2088426-Amphidinium_carterae.1
MSAVAHYHSLGGIDLHVDLRKGLQDIPLAVTLVVSEVRSGSNQDHVIDVLVHVNLSAYSSDS